MNLFEKLSLPSENVTRNKPFNYSNNDEYLFKKEFIRDLPNVFPIVRKNSYVSPCARFLNGLIFNSFQFNTELKFTWLLKLYLKFFFFLTKIRRVTRFDNILLITNSKSSYNFFHWHLDVLQKLEFIEKINNEISVSKFKIIIPNDHTSDYFKKTLDAFNFDFYFQQKDEIITASRSILLPDIAPTGNFRKGHILKLRERMRNHWINKKTINLNTKRVYISRKNAPRRKLKNEDAIIPILKKYGFTIVDFDILNIEEQLSYILNCEILVGMHGSGLSHMLWMKQKSKVLEIRTRNNSNDNCFFTLASDLGHDYLYVMADKTDLKKSNHLSDVVINTNDFSSQLFKML
mgnify:CR=1 FL=1|tara:strand:- start:5059 stop:6099 length:1041 start_codon:yes stop_codon:yes gene_type:complete